MADTASLRGAIFSILSGHDDYESLPFSTLRQEMERNIGLPHGSLKSQKSEIMDLVVEFKHMQKYENVDKGNESKVKTGKYSKQETDLILKTVHEYLAANDFSPEEICPELRDERECKQHPYLWSMLKDLLPGREAKDIKLHAILKLSSSLRKGKWKPEEKELLKNLVATHGQKWSEIGRALNRYSGDCKDAYKILKPRVITGKFSDEEDSRLLAAIREVCHCPDTLPKNLMPSHGISWNAVALAMNNERLPLDYNRRWANLRAKLFGRSTVPTSVKGIDVDTHVNVSPADFKERQLLSHLAKLCPEDESEVTWAAVDREYAFPRNFARFHWIDMCNRAAFPKDMNMEERIQALLAARGIDDKELSALETTTLPVIKYDGDTPRAKKTSTPRRLKAASIEEDVEKTRDEDDDNNEEKASGGSDIEDGNESVISAILALQTPVAESDNALAEVVYANHETPTASAVKLERNTDEDEKVEIRVVESSVNEIFNGERKKEKNHKKKKSKSSTHEEATSKEQKKKKRKHPHEDSYDKEKAKKKHKKHHKENKSRREYS